VREKTGQRQKIAIIAAGYEHHRDTRSFSPAATTPAATLSATPTTTLPNSPAATNDACPGSSRPATSAATPRPAESTGTRASSQHAAPPSLPPLQIDRQNNHSSRKLHLSPNRPRHFHPRTIEQLQATQKQALRIITLPQR